MKAAEINISDEALKKTVAFIHEYYGFDFLGYHTGSLNRRIARLMRIKKINSFAEFKYAAIHGVITGTELLNEITVTVTELFRDPSLYRALNKEVFPYLASFPQYRIWNAGCSSGEEMYALAIMLHENKLLNRSIQYGTDINRQMLAQAREANYKATGYAVLSENYKKAGGMLSLSYYLSFEENSIQVSKELQQKMVFSFHNLVSDHSFNEFQLIICRNVLIYFTTELKERVLKLFAESLAPYGYLVLGNKESMQFLHAEKYFEVINAKERIYRRKAVIE